jgi:methionine synthase II (cobalamin-independent)
VTTPLLEPGLVTGIGSLPHTDPAAAAAFALAATPALPAMPSRDGMIEHAVAGGLEDGARAFLTAHPDGPVKVQLTGPVTLAVALGDEARARGIVRANAAALAQRLDGRPVLCFLDEPAFAQLEPARAGALLADALVDVDAIATSGVHCCGSADWSVIADAGPRVLSLPVELAEAIDDRTLLRHLDRDGWIAWGAVPTDRPVEIADVEDLWRSLDAQLVRDPRLLARSIVTPACGLAHHTVESAETVFTLARELGRRIAAA